MIISFKIGDKVVCIKNAIWHNASWQVATGPKYNEDLIIDGFLEWNKSFLHFTTWHGIQYFHESNFRKLDFDFVEEVIRQVETKELHQEA